jgi:hypothetical protein
MKRTLCLGSVLLTVGYAAADSKIDIIKVSKDYYQLTYTSDAIITLENAQKALYRPAVEVCSGREPGFGKYQFESKEPLSEEVPSKEESFVFVQEIKCNPGRENTSHKVTRTLSPKERLAIEQSVRKKTNAYLDNLEASNFDVSYSMLSQTMKEMSTFEEWKAQITKFREASGPMRERDIWRITLYVDPPSAPIPGIYIAADYEESYESVPFQCGYFMWLEGETGSYSIIREESGYLDKETALNISTVDLNRVRKSFGCPAP